jgi:nucleoside-diphosphate-sugar epimerase
LITKKKILIVGGTGFIGYHLAKKSLKKGWQVTAFLQIGQKKQDICQKLNTSVAILQIKNY